MGFYTSAMYCLMSHTPAIRSCEIARFLRNFNDLAIVRSNIPYSCRIKYGRKPNKNDRDLVEQVLSSRGSGVTFYEFRQQSCEIDISRKETLVEIAEILERTPKKKIYRAAISLGDTLPDFNDRVYERSTQNEQAVCLDSWMLHIGPQIVSDSHSDSGDQFHVGYLSISLSGSGYCMPRTQRELMNCVREQPETQAVEQLCQSIWPADQYEANSKTIAMRTAMGKLWPYDELDRPVEWNWVIQESF